MTRMKALNKLRSAGAYLRLAGIENPEREAEAIIAQCLGVDRVGLFREDPEIGDDVMQHIDDCLERRARREPLQYILGHVEFHGLIIRVGQGVLIPRPETELLIEEAIAAIAEVEGRFSKLKFLDLCTGSGCIALALAKAFPNADVYGTDISMAAISYAEENAKLNDIQNVTFFQGSLFEPIKDKFMALLHRPAFDLIVSNPPYVRAADMESMQQEIRDWEPADALDGGEDGLAYFRSIIAESKKFLSNKGLLMFEIGVNQGDAVRQIAMAAGYGHTNLSKDYAGRERMITIRP